MLANIKTLLEITALFLAGTYFVYKLIDGWGLLNLSLELDAHRQLRDDSDVVVIGLKLKKGDRGSLELHTVELMCVFENQKPKVVRIPLIYPLRLRSNTGLRNDESLVHWDQVDNTRPRLHLTPGESTQYSHVFEVPRGAICTVEAIVIGKRPVSTRFGQWRASIAVPTLENSPPTVLN